MAGIEKRPSDWRVVWRQGGIRQYERFPTLAGAEQFAALVKAHGERWPHGWIRGHGFTEAPSTAPTFADWAARAIASRSTANARTRHDYVRDLERHLLPTFGDVRLDRITPQLVGEWLIALTAPPKPGERPKVSAKTAKNLHGLASSIMLAAMEQGLAPTNPFHKAMRSLPSVRQEEMVFLTRPEFDTLVACVPEAHRPLVLTLGLTGLRWSEATALHVGDIDPLTRRLTVTRAWKRTPENHFVIGEPKSRRSRRTITIPPSLLDTLLPLIAGRGDDEFLFVTRQDRPVRHSNFRARAWVPAVRAMQRCDAHRDSADPCRCPGTVSKAPRIHDARHSHASWLIAGGVNLQAIQRRLGHESITTTIDRYGHLVPETDNDITAALDGPARAVADPFDALLPGNAEGSPAWPLGAGTGGRQ